MEVWDILHFNGQLDVCVITWCAPHTCAWFAVWLLNCQLLVLYCAVYITHIHRNLHYDCEMCKASGRNWSVGLELLDWEFFRAKKLQHWSSSLNKLWSSFAVFASVSLLHNWLSVFICCPEVFRCGKLYTVLILSIRWPNNWFVMFFRRRESYGTTRTIDTGHQQEWRSVPHSSPDWSELWIYAGTWQLQWETENSCE